MMGADRADCVCDRCGEPFEPDEVLCWRPPLPPDDEVRSCPRKGVTSAGHVETCRKLEGHAGKHRFTGEGDPQPGGRHYHERCHRQLRAEEATA